MSTALATQKGALPLQPSAYSLAALSTPIWTGETTDDQALAGWLGFVSLRNQQTFRSYRAEAARFRIFLEVAHASSTSRRREVLLRDATELDVLHYEAHLLGRFKTGQLVNPLRVSREILNRHGRADQPFLATQTEDGLIVDKPLQLKPSSANQALSILHALYAYWLRPDPQTKMAYVGANPVKRVKSSTNRSQRQTSRNFPMEAITAMMQTLSLSADAGQDTAGATAAIKPQQLARQRWIVAMLFGLWGRRAEVANIRMGDFRHDRNRWIVEITRKGGKEQSLPAAPWVMAELVRYREALGMTPLPASGEQTPAIGRLRRRADAGDSGLAGLDAEADNISPDTIYRDVTTCAKQAAQALRAGLVLAEIDPVERERVACRLEEITPHWFRHSGASMAINTGAMSLENASKMLGHSSTTITAEMYYHPNEGQMEAGMQQLGAGAFGA